MEAKAIFGILSSLTLFLGTVPYIIDIHKKRAHPHILSWTGWSLITIIGASAMMADGATWASALIWANTVSCLSIAIYSIIKGVGVWSTTYYDFIFFGLGIIGLILWQILGIPVIALIFSILADELFGLPTIIKTAKNPSTETIPIWLTFSVSGALGLFAVNQLLFYEIAYPLYLFIYDTTMLIVVSRIFEKSFRKAYTKPNFKE